MRRQEKRVDCDRLIKPNLRVINPVHVHEQDADGVYCIEIMVIPLDSGVERLQHARGSPFCL